MAQSNSAGSASLPPSCFKKEGHMYSGDALAPATCSRPTRRKVGGCGGLRGRE